MSFHNNWRKFLAEGSFKEKKLLREITEDELFSHELIPFKEAVLRGARAIMTAHILLPSMDDVPATFSNKILQEILRDKWEFNGLIITDGLEMGALTSTVWHGESVLRAIEGGADILLLPPNPRQAIITILNAVESGRISEERINVSYERIINEKNKSNFYPKEIYCTNFYLIWTKLFFSPLFLGCRSDYSKWIFLNKT